MEEVHTQDMRAPSRVLLYSGHMIDSPGRKHPRFKPTMEPVVSAAIDRKISQLNFGEGDLAIGSASCGSDILAAEHALRRNIELRLYFPHCIDEFIQGSVAYANSDWVARFNTIILKATVLIAPKISKSHSSQSDSFKQTNLWMLQEAQVFSKGNFAFICVWDGHRGDGPGGTQHMVKCVRRMGGLIQWIDIRKLQYG